MRRRKRIGLVCRCTPGRGIEGGCGRDLGEVVTQSLEAMRSEGNPRKQARLGLELGDLCAASGMPVRALDIWREALARLEWHDYEWVYRPMNPAYLRFDHAVSRWEAVQLGMRIDREWRRLGHPEQAHYGRDANHEYDEMWMDKYYMALP